MSLGVVSAHNVTSIPWLTEVLADSPVCLYRHAETSGTSLVDSSGNAHNGAYAGTLAPASSLVNSDANGAMTYSATLKSSVSFASWMSLTSFSVMAWMQAPDYTASANPMVVIQKENSGSTAWYLRISSAGKLTWVVTTSTTTCSITGATSLVDGAKYLVHATYDAATGVGNAYLNGVLDGTASVAAGSTAAVPGRDLRIGGQSPNASFNFIGALDEVAMFNGALSSTRAAAHYAAAA